MSTESSRPAHASHQPSDQDASLDLDLAFAAATDVEPELLAAAGAWADPLAGAEPWHALFSGWLSALAAELPQPLQSPSYSLGLSLVGDAEIAALNAEWRRKEGPTDVLAFAAQDADLDGTWPMPWPPQADGDDTAAAESDTDLEEAEGSDDTIPGNAIPEEGEQDGDEGADESPDGEDSEDADDSESPDGDDPEPLELGDIVISLDTAARQARDHGQSLVQELQFLASHGLLHLLGWDHPDAASLEAMLQRQDKLLRRP
ncbi:MAG: rRNA maturation RNase YbeY [Cyanobacteriota bacterium]